MKKAQNTTSSKTNKQLVETLGEPKVETKVEDPIVNRLDLIIELLGSIKGQVDSIQTKVNSIQEKVPAPFDVSRLVKD
mgnify:CR=1 FL=1